MLEMVVKVHILSPLSFQKSRRRQQ